MPELPEVETIARDLRPRLLGRRVERVELRRPDMVRYPSATRFRRDLRGRLFTSVERRGKYLLLQIDSGEELVVHLGMSGTLVVSPHGATLSKHLHLRLHLDDGDELRFRDPRRFGRLLLGPAAMLREMGALPQLGPEPLSRALSAVAFQERLAQRGRAIKGLLLDQSFLAGVGNIYADEALHGAGVSPLRPASQLTADESRRLYLALRRSLRRGIANRGTSVSQYRDGRGERGRNQEELRVYGRAGEPCPQCEAVLLAATVAGRTSTYCPSCQV